MESRLSLAGRRPVVLDGFVVCAAVAPLHVARPGALDHCLAGHRSAEAGHALLLQRLGLDPLVDLSLRLGEASGVATTFEELRRTVMTVAQKGVTLQRFKGLGEMNADQLRETTMDPTTRTLMQVTMDDAAVADRLFTMLMGDKVEPRREFIEENARVATLDI